MLDSYTKTLLYFNGTDNSDIFTDENGKVWKTVLTSGNGIKLTTTNPKCGDACGNFPGLDTQCLYLYNGTTVYDYSDMQGIKTTDSDFAVGSGDYTIDFWIKTTAGASIVFYQGDNNGSSSTVSHLISFAASGKIAWGPDYTSYPSYHNLLSINSINDGIWHHIACVRYGNIFSFCVDGILQSQATFSYTNPGSIYAPMLGIENLGYGGVTQTGIYQFTGQIDDFRFSKGIARWILFPFKVPYCKNNLYITPTLSFVNKTINFQVG